eukprot:TRINITY_DN39425_c0_g2_i3.p1 TRINITY_DN39425_c0_g2~~TRINITY_DN39425_c0_g2_i3.p1  ORF type:complete len:253 (+),score=48.02 TRINITY_DN39425_c0_g2_i3:79-759(+)
MDVEDELPGECGCEFGCECECECRRAQSLHHLQTRLNSLSETLALSLDGSSSEQMQSHDQRKEIIIEFLQLQRAIRAIEESQERDIERLRKKHDALTEVHRGIARRISTHWLKLVQMGNDKRECDGKKQFVFGHTVPEFSRVNPRRFFVGRTLRESLDLVKDAGAFHDLKEFRSQLCGDIRLVDEELTRMPIGLFGNWKGRGIPMEDFIVHYCQYMLFHKLVKNGE